MNGPKNIDELRELLRPRAFPQNVPAQAAQQLSDRLRDKAHEIGAVLFGLVPEPEFHAYAGNVLHDLVVLGEQRICAARGVEVEHAALLALGPASGVANIALLDRFIEASSKCNDGCCGELLAELETKTKAQPKAPKPKKK